MTDETTGLPEGQPAHEQGENTEGTKFGLQRIYVKDISFESPNAPAIFNVDWKGDVNMQLNTTSKKVSDDGLFEVVLSLTLTMRNNNEVAYLAEVHQAGIFRVQGFESERMARLLGAYCPSVLFPYARQLISSLASAGGFQAYLLTPVNFDALYLEARKQRDAKAAEGADKSQ